ncbi:MAG: S41 family peptidase [Bacteroidota bacterium]
MRKNKILFSLIAFFVLLAGNVRSQDIDITTASNKFTGALNIINNFYVDTVKNSELVTNAIVGMLKEMDPHSVYLSKEEMKESKESLDGNFEGIGVQFNILNDTIYVLSTIPGGPSEKLGIMSGDRIVKIDDEDATGKKVTNEWVFKRLRGSKGTLVTVKIQRAGEKDLLEYPIKRDKIPIFSMDACYMAAPEIGYIKINRFAAKTVGEFNEGLNRLKAAGAKNLILDLRDNSGGYLQTAIELSDEFIGSGKTLVYTEGMNSPINRSESHAGGSFEQGKVVVLIDEGSASASEIVAGAIQDWDRGMIIGRRSYGKGLVQKPFNLPDGSVIRMTTARYHTPTGRCIQKPYKGNIENYFKDIEKRYKNGELLHPDSVKFPDSLKFKTPHNRVVYGGGGIMPDVFIPMDTSFASKYLTELYRKNVISQFCIEYVDKNRKALNEKYKSVKEYKSSFKITTQMLNDMFALGEKKGVKKNEKEFKTSEKVINSQLKALIARNLFDMNAYYECISEIDDNIEKAVEMLKNDSFAKMQLQNQ